MRTLPMTLCLLVLNSCAVELDLGNEPDPEPDPAPPSSVIPEPEPPADGPRPSTPVQLGDEIALQTAPVQAFSERTRSAARAIAFDGSVYLLAWADGRGVWATRFDEDGGRIDPYGFLIGEDRDATELDVAGAEGEFAVAWETEAGIAWAWVDSASADVTPPEDWRIGQRRPRLATRGGWFVLASVSHRGVGQIEILDDWERSASVIVLEPEPTLISDLDVVDAGTGFLLVGRHEGGLAWARFDAADIVRHSHVIASPVEEDEGARDPVIAVDAAGRCLLAWMREGGDAGYEELRMRRRDCESGAALDPEPFTELVYRGFLPSRPLADAVGDVFLIGTVAPPIRSLERYAGNPWLGRLAAGGAPAALDGVLGGNHELALAAGRDAFFVTDELYGLDALHGHLVHPDGGFEHVGEVLAHANVQTDPLVASCEGRWLVVVRDERGTSERWSYPLLYGVRYDAAFARLDPEPFLLQSERWSPGPAAVTCVDGGFLVVWASARSDCCPSYHTEVLAARVPHEGDVGEPVSVSRLDGVSAAVRVAVAAGGGEVLVGHEIPTASLDPRSFSFVRVDASTLAPLDAEPVPFAFEDRWTSTPLVPLPAPAVAYAGGRFWIAARAHDVDADADRVELSSVGADGAVETRVLAHGERLNDVELVSVGERLVAVWTHPTERYSAVDAVVIDALGEEPDAPVALLAGAARYADVAIASDGGSLLLTWQQEEGPLGPQRRYARWRPGDGTIEASALVPGSSDGLVHAGSAGRFLLAYVREPDALRVPRVFTRFLDFGDPR